MRLKYQNKHKENLDKHKTTKPWFSRLVRHPARKRSPEPGTGQSNEDCMVSNLGSFIMKLERLEN